MTSTSWTTSSPARLRAAAALALAAALGATPPAGTNEAQAVIRATIDAVLGVLRDGALSDGDKLDRIETIVEGRFDFQRMAKLVLGRNRRKLSAEQQAEFADEFRRHLSLTYGRRINRFSDETVELRGHVEHANGDVTIQTVIVGGEADGATIAYRMRERDGSWYAIDLIIEDVSLIANFRSQIQEIVTSKGPGELIRVLREKNERAAQEPPG